MSVNRDLQKAVFLIRCRADMEIHKLGERNLTIAFLEPFYTTTHLIFGENRVYVCDTFLGPESMKRITTIIKENGHQDKPIVVFNSHADWDHVWGNCYFEKAMIISHRECRNRMISEWDDELKKNQEHQRGAVTQALPTDVFDESYVFEDDSVEFFHSPGHTIDSSSCYDRQDKILFVGDNIESEVPHVNNLDFDIYKSTLEGYLAREWTCIVSGHDPTQLDDALLQSNLEYLRLLQDWKVDLNNLTENGLHVHLHTLKKLVDFILADGIQKDAKSHYKDAIKVLEKMKQNERTIEYINSFGKILE